MLVETNNLVSAEEFRRHLEKYMAAALQGTGPIAVTQDSEVVGYFIAAKEYEALFGAAVKKLLTARADGATMSHEEAKARIRGTLRRHAGKR